MATRYCYLSASKSKDRQSALHRALRVAAAAVEHYAESTFEDDAIRLFERLESEIRSAARRDDIRVRARGVLLKHTSSSSKD